MTTHIAFDTETTGMTQKPWHPGHLIELAAVRFDAAGVPIAEFRTFCNPGAPIVWPGHGITEDMLKDAPAFPEVFSQFLAFAGDSMLVGHNVSFDIDVLSRECIRHGVQFPHLATHCTLEMSRSRLPGLTKHRLGDVAAHFGIDCSGWHRALADAQVTREIFTRLRR